MSTAYTIPSRPTNTPHNGRDPVGRKYLATESGQIITTEDGKWIIAVDSSNTNYDGRPPILRGDTMSILSSTFWDDLGIWEDSKYWNDSLSIGTPYTGRIIP